MRLLWDLDGTLVDSIVDLAVAVNAVRQSHGLSLAADDEVRSWVGDGMVQLLQRAGCPGDEADGALFHQSYAATHYEGTTWYPGIAELLTICRQEWGHSLAVVTNKPAAPTRQILNRLGALAWFAAVQGGDELRKPDAAPLQVAATGMLADDCLMIGDHHTDLAAASAFGCGSIWVTWGYGERGDEAPTHVCNNAAELHAVLANLPRQI